MPTNLRGNKHQFTPEQIQEIKDRMKRNLINRVHEFLDTAGPGSYIECLNQGIHSFVKENLEEGSKHVFILDNLFLHGQIVKLIADLDHYYTEYERFDYMDEEKG